jgi:hypothetical protein
MTRGLEGRCSSPTELLARWSGRLDSNQRPPAPKAGALPGCATPRHFQLYGPQSPEPRQRASARASPSNTMLFRTRYCNSDRKSKKAWRARRAGDAGWKIGAGQSMREWGVFLHLGGEPVDIRATILKNLRKFCDAIAKCKNVDLSEACTEDRGLSREDFRISQKNHERRSQRIIRFSCGTCFATTSSRRC